jgi:ligand-binding sensor domain-containing protein/signal transduction histidine kinase
VKRTLLLIALSIWVCLANGQSYYFRHYEVENGLSNNTVFCSTQDKNGFMWFGTKDGLNRFDGYRFKVFNIPNTDKSSLSRDLISALAVDARGTLWVGGQKGLFRFDAQNETLVPVMDSLKDINDICIDSRGQLWFIAAETICRYNFESGKLDQFYTHEYFRATSLCETEDGSMWFSSVNGLLHQYDETKNTFNSYNVFAHSIPAASAMIEKIISDKDGSIFIGTPAQGIKRFNIETKEYRDILSSNADKTAVFVRDLLAVNKDEVWFATESGIFILNKTTDQFINLKKKFLDPYSLSDNAVYTLCRDSEGGIWAGTYFGGVNYYPKQHFSFQKFFPDYSENSISGSAVREICQDHDGNIWIGTEDAGISKLNPVTKKVIRFKPTGSPSSISNSNIHGLLIVGHHLWIGTFEHGLDVMDTRTGEVIKHYRAGPGAHELKSNFIVSLLQTKNGDIYAGTSNGLFKYNAKGDHFEPVNALDGGGFIACLMEDTEGNIWAGTHGRGVFFFNPETKQKGHFENQPNNKNGLTTNVVNALYQDSYHHIWIATEGGGLCRLNRNKKDFTRYTTQEGLASNFIFKVIEDAQQTLWISTSKGLVSMPVKGGSTTVYTKANGLLNDQFNYNSGYKDSNGNLYFGSVRGMIVFNPSKFYQSKFVPPLYITGFQVNNKELAINPVKRTLKNTILFADRITLPYDQSSVSLDFAALGFTSPERTEYSYKMEGADNDWTVIHSNRRVYYTNLKPGTYTFRLKASSPAFAGNQQKELVIKILPPFWATRAAYLFYFLAGTSLLYYLMRTYHNRQENKKEKEIYEAKIEFFTNIAHEIKTPLTLIKGPVENLNEMVGDLPVIREDVVTMERNTDRLVSLINQILDFRQTETKGFSLDFATVNINELLKEAFVMFEPVARKKQLSYQIDLPEETVRIKADAEALNKIFSNLFSNAVKYAEKKVRITLRTPELTDTFISIEVRNDGFLIPDEMRDKIFEPFVRLKETVKQKGTGIGLALARSLAELHQGSIAMKDPEEGMNVFEIKLPYQPAVETRKGHLTQHTLELNT